MIEIKQNIVTSTIEETNNEVNINENIIQLNITQNDKTVIVEKKEIVNVIINQNKNVVIEKKEKEIVKINIAIPGKDGKDAVIDKIIHEELYPNGYVNYYIMASGKRYTFIYDLDWVIIEMVVS